MSQLSGYELAYEFWPSHQEGEIDLLLTHSDVLIGTEVKYFSRLSSEDEDPLAVQDPQESRNQLANYARMLSRKGAGRRKFLVFLAPLEILIEVERSIQHRPIIAKDVSLGFLSWQEVLESLQTLNNDSLAPWQEMIVTDIIRLLVWKGFVRFRGFSAGIDSLSVDEGAYEFQESHRGPSPLIWPTNTIRKDDSYVFNQ